MGMIARSYNTGTVSEPETTPFMVEISGDKFQAGMINHEGDEPARGIYLCRGM